MIDPRVLPERIGRRSRVRELHGVARVEREALHPIDAELVLAVELEAHEPLLGGLDAGAGVVEDERAGGPAGRRPSAALGGGVHAGRRDVGAGGRCGAAFAGAGGQGGE